jgi:hypothetical protein
LANGWSEHIQQSKGSSSDQSDGQHFLNGRLLHWDHPSSDGNHGTLQHILDDSYNDFFTVNREVAHFYIFLNKKKKLGDFTPPNFQHQ